MAKRTAKPFQLVANGTSSAMIVIDEDIVLGLYRIRVFSQGGDTTSVTPISMQEFSDADVTAGKLTAFLRTILPGIV